MATYLLLSIEIGNRPLFSTLYSVTSPLTTAAQKLIGQLVGAGVAGTRSVGEKLFQNSHPKTGVSSLIPALPAASKAKSPSAPQEDIPEAERRELDDLIKNYSR